MTSWVPVASRRDGHDSLPPPVAREAAVAAVLLVAGLLIGYGFSLGVHGSNLHNGVIAASFTVVGLYVLRIRPGHREGRLLTAVGLVHAVMFLGRQYGLHEGPLPAQDWLAWLGVWPLPLAIAVSGWALMAFPDGRLMSPRWRTLLIAMLGWALLMAAASALWPVEYARTGVVSAHPLDLPGAHSAQQVWRYAQASYLLFQVLWTVALVARIRRAEGDEARQLRWLVYAVVIDLVLLLGGLLLLGSPVPGALAFPLVAGAAGVAILKYRLYDIDPIINRTIVVGAMLLLITAGYVAGVVGLGAVLPVPDGVLTLVTTAVVAVAFDPLRRRASRLADRLVYGRRVAPYEALSQLSAHWSEAEGDLLDGMAATVAGALGAAKVTIWTGDRSRLRAAASWPECASAAGPRTIEELDGPGLVVRPVVDQLVIRGAVSVRRAPGAVLSVAEERVLADLVAQTGLVIEYQRQREQLQAAARRNVAAQDAARRRIERDLHDGAQQRLVTLGLELGAMAERARARGHEEFAEQVGGARDQLLAATGELRELARGLHPVVLTEEGLPAALASLADRASIPVRLHVDLANRPPPEVEVTVFFLVSEALTNAARHSGADHVRVDARRVDGGLRVEVSDNGCGGARSADGAGLQGLTDRLATLGGRLWVESPAGAGTTLRAVIPCE